MQELRQSPTLKHDSRHTTVLSQIEVYGEKGFGQSDIIHSNKKSGPVLMEFNYKTAEISTAGCNHSLKIALVLNKHNVLPGGTQGTPGE